MHEYIKKLAASLCLLEEFIKDIEFKSEIKKLTMSLINFNADISKRHELRKVLIQVVDVLDILKIAKKVSAMNANIILEATVKIIEELDKSIEQEESLLLPRFSLLEISQAMMRERVKNELRESVQKTNLDLENMIFNFTKIPEKSAEEKQEKLDIVDKVENKKDIVKDLTKDLLKEEKIPVKSEPMVYTIFGEAEQNLINERRAQIMAILKNGGGSIASVSKLLPGLNPKTLQRDLIELMRERKVIMLGKKRWAKYYLK